MDKTYYSDEDITLVDSIRRLSQRVHFSDSKKDSVHSRFILEVIDDMQQEVEMIKYGRAVSSGK
jgi:hypothetical protein